ncbi:XTP/dITP diphosphatase [Fibrobacterota bacterium]
MDKPVIIIATNNLGKIREIREIGKNIPVLFKSLKDIWPEPVNIPETGTTFEENAQMKAAWVFTRKVTWTLADDSGLEVDLLNGEPGVYSSRYAGDAQNDQENIRKLLKKLNGASVQERTARFRCVMVLKGPDYTERIVSGTCRGSIALESRGSEGFGYDPIFIPDGFSNTFAEMEPSVKNGISHRGKALQALKEELYELFGKPE